MSTASKCPFGCSSIQNELSQFKGISIDYFNQIMFKFNNQDKIINELVRKLDECLNFNYENGYGDQLWQNEVVPADAPAELGHVYEQDDRFSVEPESDNTYSSDMRQTFVEIDRTEQVQDEQNDEVTYLSSVTKYSTDLQQVLEEADMLSADQISAKSAVELMSGMIAEPQSQAETITPECSSRIEAAAASGIDESGHRRILKPTTVIRTSGNRTTAKSNIISGMTCRRIRDRYSTTLMNSDGSERAIRCNLCEKEFHFKKASDSSRTYNFSHHVKVKHFGLQYQCKICKWSSSKYLVQRHIRTEHSIAIPDVDNYMKPLYL